MFFFVKKKMGLLYAELFNKEFDTILIVRAFCMYIAVRTFMLA